MANESINSTTATEEVTPVTFGFGATDNKADETQSHIDKQLPNALLNLRLLQNQKVKVLKLSLRQQMLIVSSRQKQKKFDLGDALADSATSTNQPTPAYNDALVDNIDDNNPFDC